MIHNALKVFTATLSEKNETKLLSFAEAEQEQLIDRFQKLVMKLKANVLSQKKELKDAEQVDIIQMTSGRGRLIQLFF